jgi:hypothetical protein
VGLGAIASSLAFYVLTNGAVWYAWYPHTAAALVRCYTVALPFFANGLAGDVLFAAAFFGLFSLAARSSLAPVRAAISVA